jgi:CheY-like chemotaxis protein
MAEVLVVDDDPDAAEAFAEVLQCEGHHVRLAYDGEEGIREARSLLPDLVLLDVDMPMLDGPGMAQLMLVYNMGLEQVPIILVSGVPNLRDVAKRVGTPYFLAKPFTCTRLLDLVGRALTEGVAGRTPMPSSLQGERR